MGNHWFKWKRKKGKAQERLPETKKLISLMGDDSALC